MPRNAFILRRFSDAGSRKKHPRGGVILGMDEGQFKGFEKAGMVRQASDDEVSAAEAGEVPQPTEADPPGPKAIETPKPAETPAPAPKRKPRRRKAAE